MAWLNLFSSRGGKNRRRLCGGALWLALALAAQSFPAAAAGVLLGQVKVASTGVPVEGATVTLNLEPPDATPEHATESSPFGFFRIAAIAGGTYRLRVEHPAFTAHEETVIIPASGTVTRSIALTALGGNRFDLFVQVADVTSGLQLQGVPVMVERYATALDTVAQETRSVTTDTNGFGVIRGFSDGFYRVVANGSGARAKWEGYTNVAVSASKPLLTKTHMANVLLKPIPQDLYVQVTGYSPVSGTGPLTNFFVELTGVDPANTNRVLVPARVGVTEANGKVEFKRLPAIAWRIRAKRLGYNPADTVIFPNGSGDFVPGNTTGNPVVLSPVIVNTHLYVNTTHPYTVTPLFDFLPMRIEGVTNTSAEGVNRTVNFYSITNLRDDRDFQFILPGRYRVAINAQPQFGVQGIRPQFVAEDYVDVPPGLPANGGYTDLVLPLNVVPATVRGRLFVADESGPISPGASVGGALQPRYLGGAGVTIELIEHEGDQLLKPAFRTNVVVTDASGEFTLPLLPARYGIRIAGMTNHFGKEIRLRNLTTTVSGEKDIVQGWSYFQVWPYLAPSSYSPLKFHSGHDYRMDLFVVRQTAGIRGFVTQAGGVGDDLTAGNPVGTATLQQTAGGSLTQTVPMERAGNNIVFNFPNLPPGTYTYSLAHPRFTFIYGVNQLPAPEPMTLTARAAPGVLPPVDPNTHTNAPFTQLGTSYPDTANAIVGTATIQLQLHRWDSFFSQYFDDGLRPAILVDIKPDYAGKVRSSTIPATGGFNFTANHTFSIYNFYYSNRVNAPTGNTIFDVYFGRPGEHGPLGNVADSPPRQPYDWTVRFVNDADPTQLITNVTSFSISDGGTNFSHTASGQFFTNWAGTRFVNSVSNPQWVYVTEGSQVTDFGAPAYLSLVRLTRGTTFQGSVTNNTLNLPVPNAKVQVRDRFGSVLREALADTNGTFAFAVVLNTAEPVFLDVTAPGFKPWRSRHTAAEAVPTPGDPSASTLTLNARIEPIFPSPVIQQVAMDRRGLFLPGVRLAGNQSLLTALQAVGPLTMTWSVLAKSDPVAASLVPFDAANGSVSGPQNVSLEDPVQEVWLVDPRGYTNSSYAGTPIAVPPPVSQGHPALLAWLQNIATNQLTNVFFMRATNLFATGQSGQITTTNTLGVWKLPPGDFKPVFVAVTRRGAVALTNLFEAPQTPAQLTGVRLPRWAAFAADVMGGAAGLAATQEKIKEWVPDGQFVPLPNFSANITSDASGFLNYAYALAVDWTAAEDTPGSGLLAFAPGLLGLQFEGLVSFGLNGAETNLFLDAGASVTLPNVRLPRFFPKGVTNSALLKDVTVEESLINVSASTSGRRFFDPVAQPHEFEVTNAVSGSYTAAVKANLKPVTGKLPYVGPMLLALDKSGALEISGVLDGAIGLKRTNIWRTPFPPSAETGSTPDPVKHTFRRHFLGGTEVQNQMALCFRFGTGLDVQAASGRIGARAKLNLQGNECALGPGDSAKPAALIELNPDFDWPLIQRISGNVTATLDASVSAWVVEIGRSWEWELFAFEHSFNTDPFFQWIPMNLATRLASPATATASAFNASGPLVISNFYSAGSMAVAKGGGEMLAFTEISGGNMVLKVALRTGANPFGTPVTVATAAGISAVDVAALPAGGWMAVWAQLAAGDVGNPYPASTLMFATSADGVGWSAPGQVAALGDAVAELRLVTGSTLVGLVWLRTSEGPEAANYAMEAANWNGTVWSAPATLVASTTVRTFDATGPGAASAQPAVVAWSDSAGQLNALTWDGTVASGLVIVTNNAGASLSLAAQGNGQVGLAWEPAAGGIGLFRFDTTNGWQSLGLPITNAVPSELALTALSDAGVTMWLLNWVEGGDVTSVWTAFLGTNGALLKSPANLTLNTAGRFADLQVLPRTGREARLMVRYSDGRVDVMELTAGFGTANALLDAPRRMVDGSFEFRFTGNPQQFYTLQASTNLQSWITLTNLAAPTNGVFLLDPGVKTLPFRFYRAVSP